MNVTLLKKLDACQEAQQWAEMQESPQQAWDNCPRGDWMLWLIGKADLDRKKLVWIACQCARLSLKYVSKNEMRPLKAIEVAENWTKDLETIKNVKLAAYAAVDAAADADAYAAYADAAAYAAYADAAAYAADAAAYAADAAYADAADVAAADAAYVAAAAAASVDVTRSQKRKEVLAVCADIVRKWYPCVPVFPQ